MSPPRPSASLQHVNPNNILTESSNKALPRNPNTVPLQMSNESLPRLPSKESMQSLHETLSRHSDKVPPRMPTNPVPVPQNPTEVSTNDISFSKSTTSLMPIFHEQKGKSSTVAITKLQAPANANRALAQEAPRNPNKMLPQTSNEVLSRNMPIKVLPQNFAAAFPQDSVEVLAIFTDQIDGFTNTCIMNRKVNRVISSSLNSCHLQNPQNNLLIRYIDVCISSFPLY